jgi:hypothetical protein
VNEVRDNSCSDEILLQLVKSGALDEFKEVLSQFWLAPHEASQKVMDIIERYVADRSLTVVVSGETRNISLYVIRQHHVLVLNPFSQIRDNVLLREVYDISSLPEDCSCHIFDATARLLSRLTLPKILLVNPCVLENFPIPRLALSISLPASYLRKYQKADVRLIDMQVGPSVQDIIDEALRFRPALFGMSVSFGQKYVAYAILEELYAAKQAGLIDPLVVLGNIIPASFPKEFIERYPDLVVACAEGELTILGLAEYISGKRALADVPSIAYLDDGSNIRVNSKVSVPVETIPLPALDNIIDLSRSRGALTLEISRGCQWNVCTFCPRDHKSSVWKTFSTPQILEQFANLRKVCDHFNLKKHIFLADEEFVGGMDDGLETERVAEIAKGMISQNTGMKFDTEARIDQVYNPKLDEDWHVKRMEMWHLCRQAGLERLFLGVESGSDMQLRRYGKGIKAEHSVIAIRILSALGIPLRFGFITFDQLMVGLRELKENIAFLERTDAFMKKVDVGSYGYKKLFELLVNDKDFIAEHSMNKPIYAGVSYMLATMEVLINSSYKTMLKHAESQYGKLLVIDEDHPDTNMGRLKVDFVDDLVKDISDSSQKWIDRHFGLAYAVKSLFKVAPEEEGKYLMGWMVAYRRASLFLAKAVIYVFDGETQAGFTLPAAFDEDGMVANQVESMRKAHIDNPSIRREQLIVECMNLFDQIMGKENQRLERLLESGGITDSKELQLSNILGRWRENTGVWALINDPSKEPWPVATTTSSSLPQ